MSVCDSFESGIREERGTCAPKRRISFDQNSFAFAVFQELFLRQERVAFNLNEPILLQ
jgi:hypothetical protein